MSTSELQSLEAPSEYGCHGKGDEVEYVVSTEDRGETSPSLSQGLLGRELVACVLERLGGWALINM